MCKKLACAWGVLLLGLLAACGGTNAPTTPTQLPIEILGEPGLVESATIAVSAQPSNAAYLWLKTHRLTWREDGEFATTSNPRNSVHPGSKGSVRLNGGPWVPLTNSTVTCEAHEAAFGCLNGSYMTVRVRVAVSKLGSPGLKSGDNTLDFRFDATDGVTSGWRVLGIDVRNASGASLMTSALTWDDPDQWTAPLNSTADINAGKNLWHNAALTDLGFENSRHSIRAKCASCHFADGGDLAYFNYSNKSIIARSTFHGLSETQGKQIASYIRSLDLGLPAGYTRKDAGRPWNPPYQPGAGLDAKPVELWAAGAGLDAVLERDSQMKDYMFPGGNYSAGRLGANGDLNPREMPMALQYPDWNAWLPTSGIEDLVADPSQLAGSVPITRLNRTIQALDNFRATGTNQALGESQWYFRQFIESAYVGFPTEYYYTHRDDPATLPASHATKMKQTRHTLAGRAWFNLRMFELLHQYKLQGMTERSWAAGSPTVATGYRSWGQTARTVFETAPHFVADGVGLTFNYTQPGNYLSTAWYSLEQIINGGVKAGAFGIDWNYHPGHIANITHSATGFYTDGPVHAYHMAWALIWMYQSIPTMDLRQDPPVPWTPKSFGFSQRQFGLGLGLAFGADVLEARGEITRAQRAQLQEALALAFLGVAERYRPDQWQRRTVDDEAHRSADNFETMDYVAHYVPRNQHNEAWCEWGYQADCYYERIKDLKDSGLLTSSTLNRLVNWAAGVWPRGEWAALRP